jgi:hypothetical protein
MDADEYDFITLFDPDRERSANRRELTEVIEHIQSVLIEGLMPE